MKFLCWLLGHRYALTERRGAEDPISRIIEEITGNKVEVLIYECERCGHGIAVNQGTIWMSKPCEKETTRSMVH